MGFAIITTQRSGSSWLVDLLHKQRGLTCYGELFLNQAMGQCRRKRAAGANDLSSFWVCRVRGKCKVSTYLNKLYSLRHHVGFKIMYGQLKANPIVFAYFIWRRIKVIHLVRENLLDVVVSREILSKLKVAHSTQLDTKKVRKIYIDPETLIKKMRRLKIQKWIMKAILTVSPVHVLTVKYSDLCKKTSEELCRICEFIGADAGECSIESKLFKMNPAALSEKVINYEEIEAVIRSSKYASNIDCS